MCNLFIGANNAGHAKGFPFIRRLIWVLIFIIFFIITINSVIEVFKNYYKYPVSYSVSVEHKNKVSKNSILLFIKRNFVTKLPIV